MYLKKLADEYSYQATLTFEVKQKDVTTQVGTKAQSAKGTKLEKNNETTLLRSALCLCAFATLCLSSYRKRSERCACIRIRKQ